MVDGTGLENRHTRKGIGGSNPSLSATQSGSQRNLAALVQESLKIAAIPQVLPSKCTRESVPLSTGGKSCGLFLRKAHRQSGFSDFIRRRQCDHKPMMRRKRLDFFCFWECRLMLPMLFHGIPGIDLRGESSANTNRLREFGGCNFSPSQGEIENHLDRRQRYSAYLCFRGGLVRTGGVQYDLSSSGRDWLVGR